ncbi:MAG: hypothetical protein C5B55_08265 [Blastocatellia bacterium]|nr:MAG: hypothetical protein C5B55_08265 [Blastocatellia bacterium]
MLRNNVDWIPAVVFFAVVVSWIAFALVFITRKTPPKAPDQKRDSSSVVGIAIQGLSYAIVWAFHRPYFSRFVGGSETVNLIFGLLAVILAFGSLAFTMSAVKSLGKEWSLTARVVEGHELATSGPYAWVRHPIYTGMLGMLLATGIATSYWQVLVVAAVLLTIGTTIRVRKEERLLRELFGDHFHAYAKRVSAFVPWIY